MSNINKQVGERIRMLRKERGLSQEELADMSQLHRSHLGEIERGEVRITLDTLERIGTALQIPIQAEAGQITKLAGSGS